MFTWEFSLTEKIGLAKLLPTSLIRFPQKTGNETINLGLLLSLLIVIKGPTSDRKFNYCFNILKNQMGLSYYSLVLSVHTDVERALLVQSNAQKHTSLILGTQVSLESSNLCGKVAAHLSLEFF